MNRVTDASVDVLGTFIGSCSHNQTPLMELHLSHNNLSTAGCTQLMDTVIATRRYPVRKPWGFTPLWLRVEHNLLDAHAVEVSHGCVPRGGGVAESPRAHHAATCAPRVSTTRSSRRLI